MAPDTNPSRQINQTPRQNSGSFDAAFLCAKIGRGGEPGAQNIG